MIDRILKTASEASRELSPIERSVEQTDGSIAVLSGRIADLEGRLTAVLGPPLPKTNGPQGVPGSTGASVVAQRLSAQSAQIDEMVLRVSDLIARCEV
jgi:hypothetical protein